MSFEICEIAKIPNKGRLTISMAPGKKDKKWNRSITRDLLSIRQNGIHVIVCLLQRSELKSLSLTDYPRRAYDSGFIFYHVPVRDRSAPHLDDMNVLVPIIIKHLCSGHNVLIHCRSGLGRAGTVAACCLSHFGFSFSDCIHLIRIQRPGSIQTLEQELFIQRYNNYVLLPSP